MTSIASIIYEQIDKSLIDDVCKKLSENQKVHKRFQGRGLLHIERKLPFLCVCRLTEGNNNLKTAQLIKSEPSYFIIPKYLSNSSVSLLIKQVANILVDAFEGLLIIEIWDEPQKNKTNDYMNLLVPDIKVHSDTSGDLMRTCEKFRDAMSKLRIQGAISNVIIKYHRRTRPNKSPPLLSNSTVNKLNCFSLGIEVQPIYDDVENNKHYPLTHKKVHNSFSYSLRHAYFEFSNFLLKDSPKHYHSLGSKTLKRHTYKVDKELSKISSKIDFLMWITPINISDCWHQFKNSKFKRVPNFIYKQIPIDPATLKSELYKLDMDKINDPVIQKLFHMKRLEIDRQLTMLYEINSPNFLLSSMQLYGKVDDNTNCIALKILKKSIYRSSDETFSGKCDARAFSKLAKNEIKILSSASSIDVIPKIFITEEVSGLMVNRGDLYIGKNVNIPKKRINALLQHEIGTHIVTYVNGINQPIKLFASGLPGYDEMQEGLAVFAEYLVGQLSYARIRLLAARVVASKMVEQGVSFIEIFSLLHGKYKFSEDTAYRITVRVYRGGGLTKDSIYLRGFVNIIKYIQKEGDFQTLFVGKFAQEHIPLVTELLYRGILKKPLVLPSYLDEMKIKKYLSRLNKDKFLNNIIRT